MKPQRFDSTGNSGREVRIPTPVILFRPGSIMEEEELRAAKCFFAVIDSRMKSHGGDLVIGRYSVLPYYKELENDLLTKGSHLINSYRQHRYVADLQNYVGDLEGLTFNTWNFRDLQYVPENISLVVKGETNSRKDKWNTHMFAQNKKAAIEVFQRLQEDSFIAEQDIYVREYIPLVRLSEGINGQPITMEFRFFVCYGEVVSSGFYWSGHTHGMEIIPSPSMVPQEFLQKVIDKVKDNVNFFVLDVALTESGNWIVVELNDGQMSGLSENDPNTFYKNLKTVTWDQLAK